MIRLVKYRRLAVLAVLVLVAFAGLAGWLFHRQVRMHERFVEEARKNVNYKKVFPARRGGIADARGVLLATSVPVKTVCADPALVASHRGLLAATLAPLLEMPVRTLAQRLEPRLIPRVVDGTNTVITSRYAVLRHKVPLERFQVITQQMAQLNFGVDEKKLRWRERQALGAIRKRGIFGVDDYLRQYPNGTLAAQVVGFVASGESAKDEGTVFEDQGVAGVELSFNESLNGVHGWQTADGRVPARAGQTVVLTLDASAQYIVETELAQAAVQHRPQGLVGLVLRPATGEILAMANWPAFDPNQPATNNAAVRNRAISDSFEPGSTFKVVSFTAALEQQVIRLDEEVFCENGLWRFNAKDQPLRDYRPHGVMTFEMVLAKSSNIGTAKAVERLGARSFYEAVMRFGFGATTLIPLPGEARGRVPAFEKWTRSTLARAPIGHELMVTPLQMAFATAAIANGGLYVPPRLVDRLEDADGRVTARYPLMPTRRVVSEAAAQQATKALKTVVSAGTGSSARLDRYTVAGKTGTADKWGEAGYDSGIHYSSFVGFFPADRPEVCILVSVDEPDTRFGHMGGAVAAPVFKAIAERIANYLRIPPDIMPEKEGPTVQPGPDPSPTWAGNRALAANAKTTPPASRRR